MTGRGRSAADRLNMYELLRASYDHGVICTFEFDSTFFEEDCLDRLRALSHNGNLSVLIDQGIYDEIVRLSGSGRPTQANLRYLLHPVVARGFFHPKIFLFVSRSKGRLIFGSANFTRAGLYNNAELVGCYDYESDEDESLQPLFQSVFDFLMKVGNRSRGEALALNLRKMAAEAKWLISNDPAGGDGEIDFEFLHNLDVPLWDQITSRVSGSVETVSIVSRYFDKSPSILDRVYNDLDPKKIKIYTQNYTTTLTTDYLSHPLVHSGVVEILVCDYEDEGTPQRLHAKAIAIEAGGETLLAYGSANFTSPGLIRKATEGNVEAMLLLLGLPKKRFKAERLFDPEGTAKLLTDVATLHRDENKREPFAEPTPIRLYEANLNENRIRLAVQMPENFSLNDLTAVFILQDDSEIKLPLDVLRDGVFIGTVTEDLYRRLTEAATVVRVEALDGDDHVGASNVVFVTCLRDPKTGRSLWRERLLEEARQSPGRFVEVFSSILDEEDEEAAKNFLDSFNIHITDVPIPEIFRAVAPVWEREIAMMVIRGRGWRTSESMYASVMNFFERHYKRLQKHVRSLDIEGIPNFVHIMLTTAAVLEAQIARTVGTLSARAENPMRPEEWSRCRDSLASHFRRYRELLNCLALEYLSPMLRKGQKAKIKERLMPEIDSLLTHYARMIAHRAQIEELRVEKLRVIRSTSGEYVEPPLFTSLFSVLEWLKYERDLDAIMKIIQGAVL